MFRQKCVIALFIQLVVFQCAGMVLQTDGTDSPGLLFLMTLSVSREALALLEPANSNRS